MDRIVIKYKNGRVVYINSRVVITGNNTKVLYIGGRLIS